MRAAFEVEQTAHPGRPCYVFRLDGTTLTCWRTMDHGQPCRRLEQTWEAATEPAALEEFIRAYRFHRQGDPRSVAPVLGWVDPDTFEPVEVHTLMKQTIGDALASLAPAGREAPP